MKRLFFASGLCFIFSAGYAQKDISSDSVALLNKYELSSMDAKIASIQKPPGLVNDFEHIFTTEQITVLDSILVKCEQQAHIQVAIVTLDSASVGNNNFHEFVTKLGNKWGVGDLKKQNGIIIGFSKEKRKIRISTGAGARVRLSDEEVKTIIDEIIIPEFKNQSYYLGIKKGLEAIIIKFI